MIFELLEATGRLQELGAVLYVLYSIYQELRWTPVKETGEWRAPLVIGALAVVNLIRVGLFAAELVDWLLLFAALLVAIVAGGLSGVVTRTRPLSSGNRERLERRGRRHRRGGSVLRMPTREARTGWAGAALWVVAFAARYGIEYLGDQFDAGIVAGPGLALLIVATTEAARVGAVVVRTPDT
ncbi:MAG: hypothetical protein QM626_10355 [Microbacterium sp.]|uniref:hypothetical protein n=1 Tax=Microbacterium sp. TaxID=51671 RepID=UPI0039E3C4ED